MICLASGHTDKVNNLIPQKILMGCNRGRQKGKKLVFGAPPVFPGESS